MTEFLCSTYAQLARALMEIYRDTPAHEILSMSAGVICPESDVVEIHKAMAQHRATCDVCRGNTKRDRRLSPMKRPMAIAGRRVQRTQ